MIRAAARRHPPPGLEAPCRSCIRARRRRSRGALPDGLARRLRAPRRPRLHADPGRRRRRRRRCRRRSRDRLRHRARVRRERATPGRGAGACGRGGEPRANRDQGRDGASGRGLGARRAREVDPRRLRGEPRRTGRAVDRPLSPPRAGPADALADFRQGARPARGRGTRPTRGRRQRQPASAGRGARARADRRRPGGALAVRRLGAARRRPRAARRARLALLAHSPFGGPKRAGRVDAEETLAWLLGLSPVVVPIPGARRPETAAASARAAAAAPLRRRIRRAGPASRRGATPRSCS